MLASLGPDTLQVGEDLPGARGTADGGQPFSLLLVPDVDGPGRRHLLRVLDGRQAVVGPARPWTQRPVVVRPRPCGPRPLGLAAARRGPVDTEDHLADLVVSADPEALADLRARVLAPLAGLRPATRERLAETLRSWLLHQGRRDEVAAELHVHAQTVRYRMGQLRELYGDRLDDPAHGARARRRAGHPGRRPWRAGPSTVHQRGRPRLTAGIVRHAAVPWSRLTARWISVREMFRRSGEVGRDLLAGRLGRDAARVRWTPGRAASSPSYASCSPRGSRCGWRGGPS